jgi:hypothetical protein
MYAIYGNIYDQYAPNVSIYTIHGSYGIDQRTRVATEMVVPGHSEMPCTKVGASASEMDQVEAEKHVSHVQFNSLL